MNNMAIILQILKSLILNPSACKCLAIVDIARLLIEYSTTSYCKQISAKNRRQQINPKILSAASLPTQRSFEK